MMITNTTKNKSNLLYEYKKHIHRFIQWIPLSRKKLPGVFWKPQALSRKFQKGLFLTTSYEKTTHYSHKIYFHSNIWRGSWSLVFSRLLTDHVSMYPAGIKVNNRNTRAMCEICSKLTIKIPERRKWRCSGIFIINSEHISHPVLVLLLLTLNM